MRRATSSLFWCLRFLSIGSNPLIPIHLIYFLLYDHCSICHYIWLFLLSIHLMLVCLPSLTAQRGMRIFSCAHIYIYILCYICSYIYIYRYIMCSTYLLCNLICGPQRYCHIGHFMHIMRFPFMFSIAWFSYN